MSHKGAAQGDIVSLGAVEMAQWVEPLMVKCDD